MQVRFNVTVPTTSSYKLRVVGGDCFDQTIPVLSSSPSPARLLRDPTPGESCGYAMLQLAASVGDAVIPGSACVELGRDLAMDTIFSAGTGDSLLSWGNVISWTLGGLDCVSDFTPLKAYKAAIEIGGAVWTGASAGYACGEALTESTLDQQAVASMDPNEIVGPAGSGEKRYITGEGDQLYQVLFENQAAATAPVQHLVITDKLDTTVFDPASVRFRGVRFNDTVLTMNTPVKEIDETIDLRPANPLLVHVIGTVSPSGLVRWELQAIDPETLAPPDDPLAGFLPPNTSGHDGEGDVLYTVKLRSLPEAAAVTNSASIVFDANAPIGTGTWTNLIDRLPPSVSLNVTPAADPTSATISWGGEDAASGIARWDISLSKDGGPAELWRSERQAASANFTASAPGTYSFRATAHDGAMNSTASAQSAVTLTMTAASVQPTPTPTPTPTETATGTETGTAGTPQPLVPTVAVTSAKPTLSGKVKARLRVPASGRLALGVKVACPVPGDACATRVRLAGKGLSISATPAVAAGKTVALTVKLSRAQVASLRRKHSIHTKLTVTIQRGAVSVGKTYRVTLTA